MTADTPNSDKAGERAETNIRKIDAKEARECLSRFVASHFRRTDRDNARFSIPANVNRDDDLLLGQFIDDVAATTHALAASRAEVERLRQAAANVAAMYQTDPLLTVDGLTDTDFIMRISALRAALAAQGGGT